MVVVACVLKLGGDYRLEHVERLRAQVDASTPGVQFLCLSDGGVPGAVPLRHGWPGWWSKMELFRPDLAEDMLFIDLDSAVVGDLSGMAGIGRLTIMRDVYRPKGLQSSVMFLPAQDRAAIWAEWIKAPAMWMQRFAKGGDQAFLERCEGIEWTLWQDALPGQVQSFKAHVRKRGTDSETRLVVFHGKPRPWEVGW